MKHYTDGTPYVTAVLLEGIDEDNNVYYTKHTAANKTCCNMLTKKQFIEKLNISSDNQVELLVIKYCPEIDKLKDMDFVNMYNYVFKDLYGYSKKDNNFFKGSEIIKPSLKGFNDLICYLKKERNNIIGKGYIPKHVQFRLYIHINNKIRPIQNLIKIILNYIDINLYLHDVLIEDIKYSSENVNNKLNEVLKYSSLLVQQLSEYHYDRYVSSISELSKELINYQKVNLEINKKLIYE